MRGHLDVIQYLIDTYNCDPSLPDDVNNTSLHLAALNGTLHTVKYLIEDMKCDPNSRGGNGATPLHCASMHGHLEVIKYLIDVHHCDPSLPDEVKNTPLHFAALNGRLQTVKYLIEDLKCDPNSRGRNGLTPLHWANMLGHLEVTHYLIDVHHCDPALTNEVKNTQVELAVRLDVSNSRGRIEHYSHPSISGDIKSTLPHMAALNGNLSLIKYLIEYLKCDPNSRGEDGGTPLHYASRNGHLDVIQYLIDVHHCDPSLPDEVENTPLHVAASNGKLQTVKYLIEDVKCDPNSRGGNGATPLHCASMHGHLEVIKYLIDVHHCDPSLPDEVKNTPLHFAALNGKLDTVQYLIEDKNCNPNSRGQHGVAPLHLASYNGHLDVIQYLINVHHCHLSLPNEARNSPLHFAASKGTLDTVKYLIEHVKCDPNSWDRKGSTPLHTASKNGHLDVIKYLINVCHCDPSLRDKVMKTTPLHLAALNGNLDIVKYLIDDLNCNPNSRDKSGATPLHFACEEGHLNVLQYLLDVHYCDPTLPNDEKNTPLGLACYHGYENIVKHILSSGRCELHLAYSAQSSFAVRKYLTPLKKIVQHLAASVYVVGFSGTGKTTLVNTLQSEDRFRPLIRSLMDFIWTPTVSPHTVGVVSTDFTSSHYGSVKLLDFGGQEEYHANHQLLFNNAFFPVILVTVDLTFPLDQIITSISYWLKLLTHSLKPNCTASVVVVGSHLDMISSDKLPLKDLGRQVVNLFSSDGYLKYEGVIAIDCRRSSSAGMTQLRKILQRVCDSARVQTCDVVSPQIFSIHTSILDYTPSNRSALPFVEFLSHARRVGIIPDMVQSERELYEVCEMLNHCGKLLLLRDQESYEESWLILDENLVFSHIQRELRRLQSHSCGLVSLSQLKELDYKDLALPIFIQYLLYAQICNKVNVESFLAPPNFMSTDEYYFFPGHITNDKPDDIVSESEGKTPFYSWCLKYEEPVPPRFLETLLIQLTQPSTGAGDITPPKYRVWRKGIFALNHDTTEVFIEISNSSSQITLSIRSNKGEEATLIKKRSSLVAFITALSAKHCSMIKSTEYISMLEGTSKVSSPKIPLRHIAAAIIKGTPTVASDLATHSITTLTCFEPLQLLSPITLKCLFQCHNDVVPTRVLRQFHDSIEEWINIKGTNFQMLERLSPLSYLADSESLTYTKFYDNLKEYSIFSDRNLWVRKFRVIRCCRLITIFF
jgi:ankyrin repeat protein